MNDGHVAIKRCVLSGALKYSGTKLLTYRIEYPAFFSPRYRQCLRKLNNYYRDEALDYKNYCATELFGAAVDQYNDSVKNSYPVRVFEAWQVFTAAYSRSCAVSLFFDRYEYTGGAHGSTARRSQTWNLQKCELIRLEDLVRCPPDYKTFILSEVAARIKGEPELYFENYSGLIAETFNDESFYCTPEGIVFYYQQYDIAPYSSGIREFLIPYGECVTDPANLC